MYWSNASKIDGLKLVVFHSTYKVRSNLEYYSRKESIKCPFIKPKPRKAKSYVGWAWKETFPHSKVDVQPRKRCIKKRDGEQIDGWKKWCSEGKQDW